MGRLLSFLVIGIPGLMVLLGLPLMFRLVPPNRLYGFRTGSSLATPEMWYESNRIAGIALVIAGLLAAAATMLAWRMLSGAPETKLVICLSITGIIVCTAALAPLVVSA